jgi:hypothetical protein
MIVIKKPAGRSGPSGRYPKGKPRVGQLRAAETAIKAREAARMVEEDAQGALVRAHQQARQATGEARKAKEQARMAEEEAQKTKNALREATDNENLERTAPRRKQK